MLAALAVFGSMPPYLVPGCWLVIPEAISVIHADERIVVVEKPPGLLSVPGRGAETDPAKADCVKARVRAMFPQASGPMTPHRLDQDTSGLMVLALDAEAHRHLSMQFEARAVEKAYIALIDGHHAHLPETGEGSGGEISFPMTVDWPNRPRKKHDPVEGKPSLTRYRVVAREVLPLEDTLEIPVTRLRLVPVTGRSHQLRVHCAFDRSISGLGAPIVGDTLYHPTPRGPRLMLHSAELVCAHPDDESRVAFRSSPRF